jgi:hypothetical protein
LKRGHQTRDKGQGPFLLPEGGSDSPENWLLECPYLKKTCPSQIILIFFALGCLDQKRGLILRIMVNAENNLFKLSCHKTSCYEMTSDESPQCQASCRVK